MNLHEIRQQFKIASARYDLVNTDGSDNGADYYINCGQRFLDSQIDTNQTEATHLVALGANQFSVALQYARSIKAVSLLLQPTTVLASGGIKLEHVTPSEFFYNFPGIQSSPSVGLSPPIFDLGSNAGSRDIDPWDYFRRSHQGQYTVKSVRVSPQIAQPPISSSTYNLPSSMAIGGAGLMLGEIGTYQAIWFAPLASTGSVLQVVGDFFSPILVNEYDTSYWTELYPNVLVSAARLILEDTYRNTEGVKDLLAGIKLILKGIDADRVVQEMAAGDGMDG